MEEKEKILLAQKWVHQLANGINPLNGNALKEDDIVNNVHISRCLFYVADLMGKYSERRSKSNASRNIPFDSSAMRKEEYNYVDAISISAYARELVKLIPENMQTVNYKQMVKWLMQEGMLKDGDPDSEGRVSKIATVKGNEKGIYTESRERGGGGFYLATLYNRDAQRFLLNHIDEISRIQ